MFDGETVPAGEKVVSLFEPHTDIIRKGGRTTHYGHKINLSTGRSALVLDVVVEEGKAYVHSAVFAHNLMRLSRLLPS